MQKFFRSFLRIASVALPGCPEPEPGLLSGSCGRGLAYRLLRWQQVGCGAEGEACRAAALACTNGAWRPRHGRGVVVARRTCRRRRRCLSAPSEVQPGIRKIGALEVHPAMCDATDLVLISIILSNILSSSFVTHAAPARLPRGSRAPRAPRRRFLALRYCWGAFRQVAELCGVSHSLSLPLTLTMQL